VPERPRKASLPPEVLFKPKAITTLDLVEAVVRNKGIDAAWMNIGEFAADYIPVAAGHSDESCEFRIYDFFRPNHYENPSDLFVLVGGTLVPLGQVGQCAVGRSLLQSVFSEVDSLERKSYAITEERIRTDLIRWGAQQVWTTPCLIAQSEVHYYIHWKCSSCWERYDKRKFDGTRIGSTLESLPWTEKGWREESREQCAIQSKSPSVFLDALCTNRMTQASTYQPRNLADTPAVLSKSLCAECRARSHTCQVTPKLHDFLWLEILFSREKLDIKETQIRNLEFRLDTVQRGNMTLTDRRPGIQLNSSRN